MEELESPNELEVVNWMMSKFSRLEKRIYLGEKNPDIYSKSVAM